MPEARRVDSAQVDTSELAVGAIERNGFKILLVDDDPADQALCELMLKQIDPTNTIISVECGAAALEHLSAHPVDCILLDYHLLDGNADYYIEKITAVEAWTPIIILSGSGSENKAVRAMQLGAADYLTKNRITAQALERSMINAVTKAELSRSLHAERRELLAANKELRRQSREIRSFYHTVSHELKTPITAIREFNSLLNDGVLGVINEEQQDAMKISIDCCDRLTRLVNDLFDAARIETGKLELVVESTNIPELIAREVRIMLPQARVNGLSLNFVHETDLPEAVVDPRRLSQVMCNLISNAIKYSDYGGKIRVTVGLSDDGDRLDLRVIDNGFGIASEDAELIFDRLYQCVDDTTDAASPKGGMGIGLYLCSQIVSLHGGTIRVESELGRGSTFAVSLPLSGILLANNEPAAED